MSDHWDYRSVEGLLYRLGDPPEAQVSRPVTSPGDRRQPGSHPPPGRFTTARVDIGIAIEDVLDPDEVDDIRAHYITGTKRQPYARRTAIIKKLLRRLNENLE